MADLISKVGDKLKEYDFVIYSSYPIDDKNEYLYLVDNMALIVNDKLNEISISFDAKIRPDEAATRTLILKEIDTVEEIYIMESFTVLNNSKEKMIYGDRAYKKIEDDIGKKAVLEYAKNHAYQSILLNTEEFYEC